MLFDWLGKKLLPSKQIAGIAQCVLDMLCHYEIYSKIIEGGFVHGIRRKPDAPLIDIDGDGIPDK